jgi:AAA family ATP:ADP antiporter
MSGGPMTSDARRPLLSRLFDVHPHEVPAVAAGLLMFFTLFTGYFMLRPVRETMGVAGGVDNLQWLFTGTFLVTLAVLPLYGWIASRVSRRMILPWVFGLVVLSLAAFGLGMGLQPDNIWIARAFYIWVSVVNLLLISLAWSVLADVLASGEAKRLFALVAAGASAGGLLGPLLATVLVGSIGNAGLLGLSAVLIACSAATALWLHAWRDRHPLPELPGRGPVERGLRLGGNPFAGASAVLRSPYLMGIALFVVLLATVTTFLYFEQARLIEAAYPDRADQTRVFGIIDTIVQSLAIFTQLFLTGRIARRLGVGVLLVAVPLVMAAGFLWLALSPVLGVLLVVMVVRRAGEYALVRPGREMLYTVVEPEQKYKAKNFIDTVVYRGGDALSGWVKRLLDLASEHLGLAMVVGASIALAWAVCGAFLGHSLRRREAGRR